jgi:hypothetical protein
MSDSLSLSPLLAQLPMGGINQQTEKTKTKNKLPNFFLNIGSTLNTRQLN